MSQKTKARRERAKAPRRRIWQRERRFLALAAIAVALAALAMVTLAGGSSRGGRASGELATLEQPTVRVGQRFPEFRLGDTDGRVVTPASLKSRPSIV